MEKINYHIVIASYFSASPNFFDGDLQKKPHIRKCVELPFQQTKAELWDEVTDTLCNLDFIQAKAVARMTYDLVKDFNDVLEVIPDNTENIRQEKARQARMERYARELVACAKGDLSINDLEIPESLTPWDQEKIDAEIERMKINPTRLDRFREFLNFLGIESDNLQKYAGEISHFSVQQAWNFADYGPVCKVANQSSKTVLSQLMLCNNLTRPSWNPFPQVIKKLTGHNSPFPVTSVNITPDAKFAISGSEDSSCIFWDLATGRILYRLINDQTQINTVSMTPDGKQAAAGTSGYFTIWDLTTGKALKVNIIPTEPECYGGLTSIFISPDSRFALIGSESNLCQLWNTESGQIVKKLVGHSDGVTSVCMTPDCKFAVSGSRDNTCILWDLNNGHALKILSGHEKEPLDGINSVSMTPDGKFAVSGAYDNSLIYWNLETGMALKRLKGNIKGILSVAITPDGKYALSGSMDNNCILWDLSSGVILKTLRGHSAVSMTLTSGVNSVCITPDAKFGLSCSTDRTCILWDLETGKELGNSFDNLRALYKVSVTSDGKKAISGAADNNCKVWDLETGKDLKILNNNKLHSQTLTDQNLIEAGSITPDNNFAVICGRNETCILWNLETGNPVRELIGHGGGIHYGRIFDICVSHDGRYAATGSNDQTSKYWDLETGQLLNTLNGFYSQVYAVSITPDGKNIISGSWFNDCILWNVKTGKVLNTLKIHSGGIFSLSVTPDGRRALSASGDGTAVLWDLRTWQVLNILKGHSSYLREAKISQDGSRAVSVSGDNTATLWDLATGKIVSRFVGPYSYRTLALFPQGIILDSNTGEAVVMNLKRELLCPGPGIITVRNIWDFNLHKYLPIAADCTICGHRFAPPFKVLATIETITKKASLKSDQSPCLELPDEDWEDPGLLGNCPKCGGKLKFNPFIAGGEF